MKKFISIFLTLLIIITVIPLAGLTAVAETSATVPEIKATVDKTLVEIGDIITLCVKLPDNSKLCSILYQVKYNPDCLSVIENSEELKGAFQEERINYKIIGTIKYGGITSEYANDVGQILFTIQFRVLKENPFIKVDVLEAYEDNGDEEEIDVTYEYYKNSAKTIQLESPVKIEYTIRLREPSTTTIRHKDKIILHAVVEPEMPEGYRVEWSKNNSNFKTETKNNGQSLQIISDSNGKTEFTVSLYDNDRNLVDTDSIEMNSKAGFFDKLASFFRSIFGGTKIYEY